MPPGVAPPGSRGGAGCAGAVDWRGCVGRGRVVWRRRWWVFAVAAVLLIGLAGVVVARNAQRGRYGQVYGEAPSTVAVGRGGRFSLAVADRGASVGDRWAAELRPAEAVTLARSELVAGNLLDRLTGPAVGGGGGTRYFTFDAR